ncbi:small subunit ribosomal protein S5 [Geosmithia morbida]|uniref:Small ribosomal subunit protein uS5m n=1 Tax=Geosmithia morbida TaxID=1094350 RepID=A0A9P4YXI4_9HYPO|nr:small subunit ribosomal protein S5 [Geosmithia morbida]KAF4123622.1 small subunit ribosomal protein S5 [Geosmithia morbida]
MSVSQPARSLVGRCMTSTSASTSRRAMGRCLQQQQQQQQQQFHSSTPSQARRRSQFRNVKASELGLTKPEEMARYQADKFPELTPEQREQWKAKYTPEQLAALEAGERAVDPRDMIWQGRLRDDMFRPGYVDDYAKLDPRYDLKPDHDRAVAAEETDFPSQEQFIDEYYEKMTRLASKTSSDQLSRAMLRALRAVKESKGEDSIDLTFGELERMERDPELLKKYILPEDADSSSPAGGGAGSDGEAVSPKTHPELFMTRARALEIDDAVQAMWKKEIDAIVAGDNYTYLKPPHVEVVQDSPDGVISAHSAVQPDLGKIPGVEGLYKSNAEDDAEDPEGNFSEMKRVTGLSVKEIRSLLCKTLVVRFVSNQTRLGKVRSFSVMAMAGNGNGRLGIGQAKSTDMATATATATGLAIRTMKPVRRYENRTIFGIYDLAIKFPRSKNPMNTVKATFKALSNQPDPDQIAIGRGKKLVDARKVYYGGASL